jgi:hypothetical protein
MMATSDLENLASKSPTRRSIVRGLAILLWAAGLQGALQLCRLPDRYFGEHSICGPWGCGPPLPALLAWHGFWLVLMTPVAAMAVLYLPAKWVTRLGITLASLGFLGLAAVAAWQAATWLPQASDWQRQYIGERYLFAVATLVDVPIVQSLMLGTILCLVSPFGGGSSRLRGTSRTAERETSESSSAETSP